MEPRDAQSCEQGRTCKYMHDKLKLMTAATKRRIEVEEPIEESVESQRRTKHTRSPQF